MNQKNYNLIAIQAWASPIYEKTFELETLNKYLLEKRKKKKKNTMFGS